MSLEEFKPTGVKDVSAHEFIATYAAHLKSNDKVCLCVGGYIWVSLRGELSTPSAVWWFCCRTPQLMCHAQLGLDGLPGLLF
jgi:ribosomal protein S19E (S16A)